MNILSGSDRHQTPLLPPALEDYVGPDHPVRAVEWKEKIARLTQRKTQIRARLQALAQSGESQLSTTDPDSWGRKGAHGYLVGYNVQGSVAAKHHLLVTTEVTNLAVDQGKLACRKTPIEHCWGTL